MKNLVLGALLAAAVSSAACTADTSAVITAHWSFSTYDHKDTATDPCPVVGNVNYDTATVYVRPWDPFVGDFTGDAVPSDLFSCSDKVGTTAPLDGIFQVWVQIEDHNGANVYARSEAIVIDTADGDASITLPTLFKDAGYFDMSWDLVRASAPSTRLRCADAGITPEGRISTSVQMTSGGTIYVDKFPCDDGYGITEPLRAGLYDVTITVSSMPGMDIGASAPIPDKEITAPSGLTSLGHVKITFQ
jgi:opacity protein-like surface antigen